MIEASPRQSRKIRAVEVSKCGGNQPVGRDVQWSSGDSQAYRPSVTSLRCGAGSVTASTAAGWGAGVILTSCALFVRRWASIGLVVVIVVTFGTLPFESAKANHARGAASGTLVDSSWLVCIDVPPKFPARVSGGVFHGMRQYDTRTEVSASQVNCPQSYNVTARARRFPASYLGLTTCPGGLGPNRGCQYKFVRINVRTINEFGRNDAERARLFKTMGCHEFGHVGGLAHRAVQSSCIQDPTFRTTSTTMDSHDVQAINNTYPF
jgi:hypothetical protein